MGQDMEQMKGLGRVVHDIGIVSLVLCLQREV